MNFPLNQLHTLAGGFTDWEIESDTWVVNRLPEPMRRHYAANEVLNTRARCTAGVVLRFQTTAGRLQIAVRYGLSSRQVGWGSVVVDGTPAGNFGKQEPAGDWAGQIQLGPPTQQPRQVELWLAHTAQMSLLELSSDAPLLPCDNKPRPRWLALGDSITQGADAQYPVNIGICRATRTAGLDTLNLGVGSACAEAILADLLPAGSFDLITIAYGLNDWAQSLSPDSYARSVEKLAAGARQRWPQAPIYILTATTTRDESALNERKLTVQVYRDAIHALQLPTDTRIIDGRKLVPDIKTLFDTCHPTDEGFAAYARQLAAEIGHPGRA